MITEVVNRVASSAAVSTSSARIGVAEGLDPVFGIPFRDLSLYQEIESQLTKGGIIEKSVAMDSLTEPERCLLELTKEADTVRLKHVSGSWLDYSVFVFLRGGPRVSIKPACHPGLKSEQVMGAFRISERSHDFYLATKESYYKRLTAVVKRVTTFLQTQERNNELDALVNRVQDAVEHLAPIINFVGDQFFSSEGYWSKNIGGTNRENRLLALRATPVSHWLFEDRCFVFAMSVVLQTGGAYRLEETNWRQVDPLSLDRYLRAKLKSYSLLVPELEKHDVETDCLQDLAEQLRKVEEELATRYSLIRKICGPTLNKRVCIMPRRQDSAPLPGDLATALTQLFSGSVLPALSDGRGAMRAVARLSVEANCVPDVITAILQLAQRATNSDFAMSRCNRRFFLKQDIGKLTQEDFFCAVVCAPKLGETPRAGRLPIGEVMWRQSKRMLFNCWKFWYGNLRPDERAPTQYWFIPPRMGDLSYYEDRLHAGHIEGLVAQAIRVPGDITFHDTETGETRKMIASMDIRMARSSMDCPYGTAEYLTAEGYSQILNWFYCELAAMAPEGRLVTVSAFQKQAFLAAGSTSDVGRSCTAIG